MKKRIVGYTDRISVAPGEEIRFMVSCERGIAAYQASILRMVSGDTQPGGPGLKTVPVASAIEGEYPARTQPIRPGSYGVTARPLLERPVSQLTCQANIFLTAAGRPQQTIFSCLDEATGGGFEIFIDAQSRIAAKLGHAGGKFELLTAATQIPLRTWTTVSVSFDGPAGTVELAQRPTSSPGRVQQERFRSVAKEIAGSTVTLYLAASGTGGEMHGFLNGRIERPAVAQKAFTLEEMNRLRQATSPLPDIFLGLWDFSRNIAGNRISDISGHERHGTLVNLPVRALRGTNWNGEELNWTKAPEQYGAIHFLEDGLSDCGWQADFALQIPTNLPSGVYAAWLRNGGDEDYIPFFVRPPRGMARERIALLIPTVSYLAYANWRLPFENPVSEPLGNALPVIGAEDLYLIDHPELGPSLYDTQADGSSATFSSWRRPNLNMRPGHGWLEQFTADLYLTGWLEQAGIGFDVVTDHDLHEEGVALLSRYRCVLSGTHPEYYTTAMWDGLHAYMHRGGRFIYLGGNGFVWRVALHPDEPWAIELRRAEASSSIGHTDPGEYYMASTGEYGGPWEKIGRPPASLVSVSYVTQGFDYSTFYRRTPESFDPRVAFIVEGLGPDEVIGDFGLLGNGAAGVEVDAIGEGTPPQAVCLATSVGAHTDTYRLANFAGLDNPPVRSDLVFCPFEGGGAVFSVGSMAWGPALPHNNYDNNVARITANVLRRFLDARPFD